MDKPPPLILVYLFAIVAATLGSVLFIGLAFGSLPPLIVALPHHRQLSLF